MPKKKVRHKNSNKSNYRNTLCINKKTQKVSKNEQFICKTAFALLIVA